MMLNKAIAIVAIAFSAITPAAIAGDDTPDWIMDTSGVGRDTNGVVRSDQILELGVASSSALQLEGEHSLRMGNLDQALVSLQRAVELSPMDMDKRTLYAQTLEKKLLQQKKKDPKLYNFVVKQWLFICRKAEFVDQSLEAKSHLASLTGTVPKAFEKSPKFLARVLVPEDAETKVVVGKKSSGNPQ